MMLVAWVAAALGDLASFMLGRRLGRRFVDRPRPAVRRQRRAPASASRRSSTATARRRSSSGASSASSARSRRSWPARPGCGCGRSCRGACSARRVGDARSRSSATRSTSRSSRRGRADARRARARRGRRGGAGVRAHRPGAGGGVAARPRCVLRRCAASNSITEGRVCGAVEPARPRTASVSPFRTQSQAVQEPAPCGAARRRHLPSSVMLFCGALRAGGQPDDAGGRTSSASWIGGRPVYQ